MSTRRPSLTALAAALFVGGLSVSAPTAIGAKPTTVKSTAKRPAMKPIAAGTFTMGSPASEAGREADEVPHAVKLTVPFWLAETEVTQGQYQAVMGENPSHFCGEPADEGMPCTVKRDADRPVENVTWLDAIAYCNALSKAEGLRPVYAVAFAQGVDTVTWDRAADGYRLPTEAEWAYAARAGTSTATYAGDPTGGAQWKAPELKRTVRYAATSRSKHPKAVALFDDGSGDSDAPAYAMSTHPVKSLKPNPWGLHGMLGNVAEWTWDRYDAYAVPPGGAPAVDPANSTAGSPRTMRGGGWFSDVSGCRAARRQGALDGSATYATGFRIARNRGPGEAARPK